MPKRVAHVFEDKWRSNDVRLQEEADFSTLLLSDEVMKGLNKAGFKRPSPIQLEAIPAGRFGKDLVIQAKSGTGKTLVFTIVALEQLVLDVKQLQVLILAPTREIAVQICDVIKVVGSSFKHLKCNSFIGGQPVEDDVKRAHSCQIAVGTPGRIRQLIEMKILATKSVTLFVLDEADILLEKSFKTDIEEIFLSLPQEKQLIASSATYTEKLKKLVLKLFKDHYEACLTAEQLALLGTAHYSHIVPYSSLALLAYKFKIAELEKIMDVVKFNQCLVFCNQVSSVEVLCNDIRQWGFTTTYISREREQCDRLKAIECLKRYKCKVLVSSDVTSRGIDAENVDLIINFDMPLYPEVYLHRVGRAGRYGSKGVAITFLTHQDLPRFKRVKVEANFKSYILPTPCPEDLINYIPEDEDDISQLETVSPRNKQNMKKQVDSDLSKAVCEEKNQEQTVHESPKLGSQNLCADDSPVLNKNGIDNTEEEDKVFPISENKFIPELPVSIPEPDIVSDEIEHCDNNLLNSKSACDVRGSFALSDSEDENQKVDENDVTKTEYVNNSKCSLKASDGEDSLSVSFKSNVDNNIDVEVKKSNFINGDVSSECKDEEEVPGAVSDENTHIATNSDLCEEVVIEEVVHDAKRMLNNIEVFNRAYEMCKGNQKEDKNMTNIDSCSEFESFNLQTGELEETITANKIQALRSNLLDFYYEILEKSEKEIKEDLVKTCKEFSNDIESSNDTLYISGVSLTSERVCENTLESAIEDIKVLDENAENKVFGLDHSEISETAENNILGPSHSQEKEVVEEQVLGLGNSRRSEIVEDRISGSANESAELRILESSYSQGSEAIEDQILGIGSSHKSRSPSEVEAVSQMQNLKFHMNNNESSDDDSKEPSMPSGGDDVSKELSMPSGDDDASKELSMPSGDDDISKELSMPSSDDDVSNGHFATGESKKHLFLFGSQKPVCENSGDLFESSLSSSSLSSTSFSTSRSTRSNASYSPNSMTSRSERGRNRRPYNKYGYQCLKRDPRISSRNRNSRPCENMCNCSHCQTNTCRHQMGSSSSVFCRGCTNTRGPQRCIAVNRSSCSSCWMPSQHLCHPENYHFNQCNQMHTCAEWYKTFINQWVHIQKCVNPSFCPNL